MTAVKEKPTEAETEGLTDAKTIEIDPRQVIVDVAGQKSKSLIVHAPEGAVPDDLRTPSIWRKVQIDRSGRALAVYDTLRIYAFDDSWRVKCEVVHATSDAAYLKLDASGDFQKDAPRLFQDDRYKVEFSNGSFWVRDKRDGRTMGHGHGTEALAVRHLTSLYPKQVG